MDPVPRREQIQMKHVLAGRLIIEAIENRLVVADVVERSELRRIEKTSAANAVNREEVAELRVAESQAEVSSRGAEGAVARVDIAEHFARAQAGARGHLRHQAGLIAKLRAGRSGDQLHALNRAGGQ